MNAEEICEALVKGSMTKEQALAELMKIGYSEPLAGETVFLARGGDDVVV